MLEKIDDIVVHEGSQKLATSEKREVDVAWSAKVKDCGVSGKGRAAACDSRDGLSGKWENHCGEAYTG